jgi:hypothetical protein
MDSGCPTPHRPYTADLSMRTFVERDRTQMSSQEQLGGAMKPTQQEEWDASLGRGPAVFQPPQGPAGFLGLVFHSDLGHSYRRVSSSHKRTGW